MARRPKRQTHDGVQRFINFYGGNRAVCVKALRFARMLPPQYDDLDYLRALRDEFAPDFAATGKYGWLHQRIVELEMRNGD